MASPHMRPARAAGFGRTIRNLLLFVVLVFVLAGVATVGLVYWEISTNLPPVDTSRPKREGAVAAPVIP